MGDGDGVRRERCVMQLAQTVLNVVQGQAQPNNAMRELSHVTLLFIVLILVPLYVLQHAPHTMETRERYTDANSCSRG